MDLEVYVHQCVGGTSGIFNISFYLIGQNFGGKIFSEQNFGGQNFRHQLEISSFLSAEKNFPPKFCKSLFLM